MWWKETLYYLFGWLIAFVRRNARIQRVRADGFWHKAYRGLADTGNELNLSAVLFWLIAVAVLGTIVLARPAASMMWQLWWILGCATILMMLHIALRLLVREQVEQQHTENQRRFEGVCRPDSDPFNTAVVIRGNVWCDRENFLNEFRAVPEDATGVVLVLRQTPAAKHHFSMPYAFESMRRQLEARSKHPELSKIKVDWVCFENKFHTVEAYMSYGRFESDILERKNTAYAQLLSITGAAQFRKFLADHSLLDGEQKKTGISRPDTICGLEKRWTSHKFSKLDVLTIMLEGGAGDIMLVSKDRKRLGIVTLAGLVKVLLGGYTDKNAVATGLNKRIQEWNEASAKLVKKLEDEVIAELPPVTGDDWPGRGAGLPPGIPFSGPVAGRLMPR